MTQDILAFAQEKIATGNKIALVAITETHGSSPASVGQIVVVSSDGFVVGTVGGGSSEHVVILRAKKALADGDKSFEFSFDHSENGMVCGGGMKGFGTILGNENQLVIFGGGHVAQSLAPVALSCGFFVTVVEDRPELKENFDGVNYIVAKPSDFADMVRLSDSSYIVITTRGHATDYDALEYALMNPHKYIGMIGSNKKVATLIDRLKKDGIEQKQIDEIFTPIGIDIASEVPAEIAISIMAEILMIKNSGTLTHKKKSGN